MTASSSASQPSLEYWYSSGSCSVAGHVLLHESGLAFKSHFVPRKHEPNSLPPSYTSVNPRKLIPSLSIGGEVITELPAILVAVAYLAHKPEWVEGHPTPSANEIEKVLKRGKVYEWINFLSSYVHSTAFAAFFRPYRFMEDEAHRPAVKEKGKATVLLALDDIEAKLPDAAGEAGFVVDGQYSIVDPFVYLVARWAELVEPGVLGRYPNLQRFARMMEGREATRKAVESEEIHLLFPPATQE